MQSGHSLLRDVTTIYYLIREKGLEAYLSLIDLQGFMKDFHVGEKVFDEQWTFYGARLRGRICGFGIVWLMVFLILLLGIGVMVL